MMSLVGLDMSLVDHDCSSSTSRKKYPQEKARSFCPSTPRTILGTCHCRHRMPRTYR